MGKKVETFVQSFEFPTWHYFYAANSGGFMAETVVIVGGGVGGLTTGALLAKEGYKVTVLEKNATIGGGLQTFHRNGIDYVTGMHIVGGFHPNGVLYRICKYLEIIDQLKLVSVDAECMDQIAYASDGRLYKIASGRSGFIDSLTSYFPQEHDNIVRYLDTMYEMAGQLDHFNLRPTSDDLFQFPPEFFMPADEFINQFTEEPRLRDLFAYMNSLHGAIRGKTPAYIHALLNVFYIEGVARFVGGSFQLAKALCGVIRAHGGEVFTNAEVTHIAVHERNITYIEIEKGQRFQADHYISAVHVNELLRVIDNSAFPKSFFNRVRSIPNTYSAFFVFIELKEGTFPYINHTCYYEQDYGLIWELEVYNEEWPRSFMYMTPPVENQGEWATHLVVNVVMPYDAVRKWENTETGKRGTDYEMWKQERVEKVLDRFEELYPDFRSKIRRVYAASPLTVRDYYHSTEGAIYGYAKDCQNIMLSQISIFTKVKNLLLTGQCIRLHGICGVPLTAISTVEALIGRNKIIEKL